MPPARHLPLTLEELHRPLVLLRGFARAERAQVPALAGLRVYLPRVQAILARFQLADHLPLLEGQARSSGLVTSGTSQPRAVASSIWWSCSCTRICRICSARAYSPSASHWRTRSR